MSGNPKYVRYSIGDTLYAGEVKERRPAGFDSWPRIWGAVLVVHCDEGLAIVRASDATPITEKQFEKLEK